MDSLRKMRWMRGGYIPKAIGAREVGPGPPVLESKKKPHRKVLIPENR